MKVDLNFELLSIDGTPIEGAIAGKLVAQRIATANQGDALKLFGWATKLYKGDALDLDASDMQVFRSLIENDQELTILTKAQVMEVILAAKEKKPATVKKA